MAKKKESVNVEIDEKELEKNLLPDVLAENKAMKIQLVEQNIQIEQLKSIIAKLSPNIVTKVEDEEMVARNQLEFLKRKGMLTELSLEEVKKMEMLVKIKRLSQGKSTVNTTATDLEGKSEKELLRLAGAIPIDE